VRLGVGAFGNVSSLMVLFGALGFEKMPMCWTSDDEQQKPFFLYDVRAFGVISIAGRTWR
jgi:hypothetical protein